MAVLAHLPTSPEPNSMPKTENKFYAFFRSRSRSRSRSRANTGASSCTPESMTSNTIPIPQPHSLRIRRPSLTRESMPSENPPSSYSPMKSSVRSQSRPISSTTTATHSTIAPLPSDSLRRRTNEARHDRSTRPDSADIHESSVDQYQPGSGCEHGFDEYHPPRSETPSSARRKLALHTFLGISLTRRSSSNSTRQPSSTSHSERNTSSSTSASEVKNGTSRRRSFRLGSRPTTPKSGDDHTSSKSSQLIPIPSSPLPLSASPRRRSFGLNGGSQRSTPKSSTGHLPLPTVHSNRTHGRRQSVSSQRTPHDSAVALPESGSASATDITIGALKSDKPHYDVARSKGKEKQSDKRRLVTRFASRTTLHSATDFTSQSLPADTSHLSTVEPISFDETEGRPAVLAPRPKPIIPQIIHTPPTPQRTADVDTPLRPNTSPPRVDAGKVKVAPCKADTSSPNREQVLVSSAKSYSATSKSHAEVTFQHSAPTRSRFPPWLFGEKDSDKGKDAVTLKVKRRGVDTGPPDVHGHQAHTSNVVSPPRNIMSRRAKHGSFDFERPVSALNRSNSTINRSKYLLPSLERSTSTDSTRAGKLRTIAHHQVEDSPTVSKLKPNHSTSVASLSSTSVQTKSTGKGTGPSVTVGQSSSWGRASGKRVQRTSHGTFSFEHPASVQSSPVPLPFNLPNNSTAASNGCDTTEHVIGSSNVQTNAPLRTIFASRPKHSRGHSHTPEYVNAKLSRQEERKSKGKGRSLDLGLGLSWAPSHVREEAVMPGLSLARENRRARRYGSDVTKTFETVLSPSGFEAFKMYVHRFDAHAIPLEGPSGLLTCVDRLLANSGVSDRERNDLMVEFTVFVEGHGG
ncbi:hypothetical protein F5I97DRAFT_1861313 [Phlebopus sp. FC_14]|nr:hypothetical protein F5I97DRAFT_1861313 [Phlebopus sp. FC_14]